MPKINLLTYKITELNFKNAISSPIKLKFGHKLSHHVKYSDNKMCEAFLKLDVLDAEHPDSISISLTLQGLFRILEDTEREFIHVETFKSLYPMARAIISTISGAAGIPPIIIKDIDMENQEIYRMEMDGKATSDTDIE